MAATAATAAGYISCRHLTYPDSNVVPHLLMIGSSLVTHLESFRLAAGFDANLLRARCELGLYDVRGWGVFSSCPWRGIHPWDCTYLLHGLTC